MLALGVAPKTNNSKYFRILPVVGFIVAVVTLGYGLIQYIENMSPLGKLGIGMFGALMLMIFLLGLTVNTGESTEQIGVDVKALVASIENDSCWVATSCRLRNQRTGAELWIANGEKCIDYFPNAKAFNAKEKAVIYRSVKIRLAKNAILPKGE